MDYPWAWPSPGCICPRDSQEVAWVLHESGYSLLVLGIWPWSHLSLLFITALRYRGPRPPRPYRGFSSCRPLHGLPYPWVSRPKHALRTMSHAFKVGDAYTWRRPHLAMPTPSDAQSGRHTNFSPWSPLVGPTICLTLVDARGRVGTQSPQSWADNCFQWKD